MNVCYMQTLAQLIHTVLIKLRQGKYLHVSSAYTRFVFVFYGDLPCALVSDKSTSDDVSEGLLPLSPLVFPKIWWRFSTVPAKAYSQSECISAWYGNRTTSDLRSLLTNDCSLSCHLAGNTGVTAPAPAGSHNFFPEAVTLLNSISHNHCT